MPLHPGSHNAPGRSLLGAAQANAGSRRSGQSTAQKLKEKREFVDLLNSLRNPRSKRQSRKRAR